MNDARVPGLLAFIALLLTVITIHFLLGDVALIWAYNRAAELSDAWSTP
jgi:hypothetical protein